MSWCLFRGPLISAGDHVIGTGADAQLQRSEEEAGPSLERVCTFARSTSSNDHVATSPRRHVTFWGFHVDAGIRFF